MYPVDDGIVHLLPSSTADDLWEEGASGVARYLADHPDVARRFADAPPDELAAADRLFQVLIAEDAGDWERARRLGPAAEVAVYGAVRIAARDEAIAALLGRLPPDGGPILDLACGRGTLLARLVAARPRARIVAGDISPRILRRARARIGGAARPSFVALDGRAMPFGDGVLGTVVTYAGLANIGDGDRLLAELRRVTDRVLAVHEFMDASDARNAEAAAELGIADLIDRHRAEEIFRRGGWSLDVAVVARLVAAPTPAGELIPGAVIDGLPVAPVGVEVCVLDARRVG